MSLKIITKNKRLKATRNSLEKELSILKEKVSTLEKNKGVDLECVKCHMLKIKNEKLKEEALRLTKFEKSTHCLNEMLSNQKPSGDKLGLGFNSFEASSSGTKEIKFVKAQKKASSDGGPINMGGPFSMHAAHKAIIGPPLAATPGSEKSVSFQKSILGLRPKHIIVNNVKVPVASDNEVKQFYKPLLKPRVGFSKPNLRSKTPPPIRVINNYPRPKTPQPKRNVGRQNQPRGFPICFGVDLEPDEWIKDSRCSKHMTGKRKLFSGYKAYNGGNINFDSNLRGNIIDKVVEESLNVTFDETPLPSKTSPFVDDDLDEEEAINVTEKKILENDIVNETLEIDKIVNIKESRNHPLENVIGNLNQRTLRSLSQNQSNFFCFISAIEPKKVNEALADDSWIVAMQEELNQFIANDLWELVLQPRNKTIIGAKWVFRNKLDEKGIVSRNKARLVAQGYNQQEGVDYDETYALKQTALAISTTEADYVSAGKACQQVLWMKQALIDYDVRLDDVPIMCDNKGAIDLSKNPMQHSRTKHIEIHHHFLCDNVQKGHISIKKVSSIDNIADILTKPLKRESFNYLRLGLGMMEHIP
ncbi:retrovirus-related pol polyprotein from transposon TNT 1-94 [Tanacetum coccineum]|uniref:Retrovirus-related pol polyprotein from transposon TNT 1-94 n=1 Tax=Tanacetum coccineum TaxID=301880 RepID=A0ABQ4XIF0_9ASTR